jgi:phosphoserine phosphatase
MTVLDVSRRLAATTDLQELLEAIESAVLAALDCERASIFLHEPATGELVSKVATGGKVIRFPATAGIAGETLRTGHLINVPDAWVDSRFNPDVDRRTGFRTRSLLSCAVRGWEDTPIGVLQALNKRSRPFDTHDAWLATALAAQAGVAVQRQRLLESYTREQKYRRELDLARQIQRGLLPRRPIELPGCDVAGWSEAAEAAGGDVFDYRALDDGTLALTVADASGHGIVPALLITQYRTALRAAWSRNPDPGACAGEVDALLSEDLPEERFVTAFFGRYDPHTGRLRYLSAGHGPVLAYRPAKDQVEELDVHGPPLGVAPGFPFQEPSDLDLGAGDLVLIPTDGITEWANPAGAQFGLDRIAEVLRRHHTLSAADLIAALHKSVVEFADGVTQADDLTAIAIRRR